MLKRTILFLVNISVCLTAFSQEKKTSIVQITTIESTVSGGAGRSRMFITSSEGKQEEKEINNLFSLVGINFKNIKGNETSIIQTIKQYTDQGWKLVSTTPLTISPSEGGQSAGMFMTRYLLIKEVDNN